MLMLMMEKCKTFYQSDNQQLNGNIRVFPLDLRFVNNQYWKSMLLKYISDMYVVSQMVMHLNTEAKHRYELVCKYLIFLNNTHSVPRN